MATRPTRLLRIITLLQQDFVLTNRVRVPLRERLQAAVVRLEEATSASPVDEGEVNDRMREVKACMVRPPFLSTAIRRVRLNGFS